MKKSRHVIWWKLCLLALLLSPPLQVFAQSFTVKGKVVDETQAPVIGASVLVKGTTTGTSTDIEGNFSLTVSGKGKTLLFSYVGMTNQEIPAEAKDNLVVVLKTDALTAEDVVVVGYMNVVRKDLTGSVGSVSGEKLAIAPVASAAEALQGKIAGVQVTTLDGAPGAEINIRIRGQMSLDGKSSPLYIIDGFPADNMNDIPPTDIQSIDVLKDASLTAIYGARGANGVVMVTTKSAKAGKMKIEANFSARINKLNRKLDLLDSYEFTRYQLDAAIMNNSRLYDFHKNFGNPLDMDLYKNIEAQDWQDQVMGGTPVTLNYNVTVGGGSDKIRYNVSFTHNDEKGILLGTGVKRTNFNAKINAELAKNLTLLVNPRFTVRTDDGSSASDFGRGGIVGILRYRPHNGIREFAYIDPEYADPLEEAKWAMANPVEDVNQNYRKRNQWTFVNQASLEWKPVKGLRLRSEFSHTMGFDKQQRFYGYLSEAASNQTYNNHPFAEVTDSRTTRYTWTNTATYGFTTCEKHNLSFLVGQEIQHHQSRQNYADAIEFPDMISPERALNNMGLGKPYHTSSAISTPNRTASFFAQATYNYDHKYYLSATFRADGSSRFAPGNRWGYFPSISGAWAIDQENFLKDSDILDELKLRVAFGLVGNNNIGDDLWRYTYTVNSSSGPDFQGGQINGENYYYGGSTFPNPDVKWETTVTRNVALDVSLWNKRLTITPEFYWNTTRDMLYTTTIPTTTGYSRQLQNIGQVTNKGFELTVNGTVIAKKDFDLALNATFGFNRSRVDKINGEETEQWFSSPFTGTNDYLMKVGEPLGVIYGYVYDGLYGFDDFDRTTSANYVPKLDADGNQVPVNCDGLFGTAPGRPKFKNFVDHGGGREDDVNIVDDYDRVKIGDTTPDFTGGFGITAHWKGFDLTANFNYMYGFDVYNGTAYMLASSINNSGNYYNVLSKYGHNSRWNYTNDKGERILANSVLGSYLEQYYEPMNVKASAWNPVDVTKKISASNFVEDGSFLRLQDITIGYTLPERITKKFGVSRLRVYFTGSNLWLLTGYSGYDPEVDLQTGVTPGIDYNRYPRSCGYLFGVNLTF